MGLSVAMRTIVTVLIALPLAAQPKPPVTLEARRESMEQQLEKNPGNLALRSNLLSMYPADAQDQPIRERRRYHILWLIENHPEFADLAQFYAILDPKDDPDGHSQSARLWKQAAKPDADPRIVANAVAFFQRSDPAAASALLNLSWSAHPQDPVLAKARGQLDVLLVLGITRLTRNNDVSAHSSALRKSPEAAKAREEIEASDNPELLSASAETMLRYAYAIRAGFSPYTGPDPATEPETLLATADRWATKAHELAPANEACTATLVRVYERRGTLFNTTPAEQVEWLRKADALATSDQQRMSFLPRLALAEFDSGDDAAAERDAKRTLDLAGSRQGYFNLLHLGNTVLGRLALAQGNKARAKEHFLASTQVGDRGGYFQPNLTLAQDLLDAGERAAVLEFLEKCRSFWRYDRGQLDHLMVVAKSPNGDLLANYFFEGIRLVGGPAPTAKLHDDEGGEWSADPKSGKATVLYFHTESCKSCEETSKALDKLAKEFSARGVTVVSVDGRKERSAATAFMIDAYPSIVTVDRQGLVAGYSPGNVPESQLRREFETALQGASTRLTSLAAPIPRPVSAANGKATLAWDPVDTADSYVVQWDRKDAQGWESDRGQGFVRILPTRETSATLDLPSDTTIRWRVQAVGPFRQSGKLSTWQELPQQ